MYALIMSLVLLLLLPSAALAAPNCGAVPCKCVWGPCDGGSPSEPQPFSPLLPDFTNAQSSISASLQSYSRRSDTIMGEVTAYLLTRMPSANPRTEEELDEAAENLAQFVEGYRQAYERAAERVAGAEKELIKNREAIAKQKRETQADMQEKREWELRGGPRLVARLRSADKYSTELEHQTSDIATDLIEKIDNSAYRNTSVWRSTGTGSKLSSALWSNFSQRRDSYAREESRRMLLINLFLAEPVPSVSPRSAFTHIFPRRPLPNSDKQTADARIRENLGFIQQARLIEAIRKYIDSTKGDPAGLIYEHEISKRDLVLARKEYADLNTWKRPNIERMSSNINDMKVDGIAIAVRWAFWKSLEKVASRFLEGKIGSEPSSLVHFAEVQEQVVLLANEIKNYLPEVARALASRSPEDASYLRMRMNEVFCEYSAAFETKAWPLPRPFDAGPFDKIIPTPDKIVCK
jgi:hypothetical protein